MCQFLAAGPFILPVAQAFKRSGGSRLIVMEGFGDGLDGPILTYHSWGCGTAYFVATGFCAMLSVDKAKALLH
jgi:hypothetical protein